MAVVLNDAAEVAVTGVFPRVLIVIKSQINDVDSTGMSLRNWFHNWPSESLAQIYSGVAGEGAALIGSSFQLGVDERRFGWLFFSLKRSPLSQSAMPYSQAALARGSAPGVLRRFSNMIVRRVGEMIINTGLWELLFPPRLSPLLRAWITEFKPDVMFVQGGDISFMRLPVLIGKEFNIPICFDVVDDWVEHLYKRSVLSPLVQPVVKRSFRRLIEASPLCFAIGPNMVEEYKRRYGVSFKTLMQCADQSRYPVVQERPSQQWDTINIVYSGSLVLDRWRGILELSKAASVLSDRGLRIVINVYAPYLPPEAAILEGAFAVTLHEAVPDCEVPALLSSADILFLPESFDSSIRSYTRFSISTKAHLYMMSGRLSLVYGPPEIGTVDYARKDGWGFVVNEQSVDALVAALEQMAQSPELRQTLIEKSRLTVQRNHSDRAVREQLRNDLLMIVKGKDS